MGNARVQRVPGDSTLFWPAADEDTGAFSAILACSLAHASGESLRAAPMFRGSLPIYCRKKVL